MPVICLYVIDDVLNEWHYVSGIWLQKQIRHHLLHPLQAVLSYPAAGPCLWATFFHDSLSHPHPTPIIYEVTHLQQRQHALATDNIVSMCVHALGSVVFGKHSVPE